MKPDVLSQDFRAFKRKSEVLLPHMSREEALRVKRALEFLVVSFDRHLAMSPATERKAS